MLAMINVTCAICGTRNEVPGIRLPDPLEPPDFDTRPGEPLRSTLGQWIQRCSNCGYCAEEIASASADAQGIVSSEEYQAILADDQLPPSARPFLAYSCLLTRHHQHADAGWSSLHAAWACDDAEAEEAARRCRARAMELWRRGKQAGQAFGDDLASEFALIADLHRRLGEFEHATVACAEALDIEDLAPPIEALLRKQMTLIQAHDTSAHNFRELLSRPVS